MNYENEVTDIRDAVENALQAVYETQTNNSSANYQHSEQLIAYAKARLHDFRTKDVTLDEEDERELLRAKELLRQVEETQAALTFY